MDKGAKSRQSKKARQCNGQCKLKDIKGEPNVVNQRRPDNAMANVSLKILRGNQKS